MKCIQQEKVSTSQPKTPRTASSSTKFATQVHKIEQKKRGNQNLHCHTIVLEDREVVAESENPDSYFNWSTSLPPSLATTAACATFNIRPERTTPGIATRCCRISLYGVSSPNNRR